MVIGSEGQIDALPWIAEGYLFPMNWLEPEHFNAGYFICKYKMLCGLKCSNLMFHSYYLNSGHQV